MGESPPSASGIFPAAFLCLLAGVFYAGYLPASRSFLNLLIQPVTAVIFAWILFAEAMGPGQFAGAAIVLTGIWLARQRGIRPQEPECVRLDPAARVVPHFDRMEESLP